MSVRRGREQRSRPGPERLQGGAGPGQDRAPAGQDQRRAGLRQHIGDPPHVLRRRRGHGGRVGNGDLRPRRLGGLHIEGQAEQNRAAPQRGVLPRSSQVVQRRLRGMGAFVHRTHRRGESGLVDPEIGLNRSGGGVRSDHNERRPCLRRLREGRGRVGETRALVDGCHSHPSADSRVGVGHAHRGALVASRHEAGPAAHHRVRDREIAASDESEGVGDAEIDERRSDRLGDVHRSTRGPRPLTVRDNHGTRTAVKEGVSEASRKASTNRFSP